MGELRIPQWITELVLNHRPKELSGVAKVYNRFDYASEKANALEAWARRVQEIVSGDDDVNVVRLKASERRG